ncbi:hypothetical protein HN858_02120 [Candidatus Falkowbacteria bacterium]|jgi:hypothetical protein|nr:hypothetical protein [Candidatus Falkowbacteria bacterium]MBT5502820.1 hypothetical protein [Candidatus Falkowbacteria bacterium]MBT6573409.1 hypothetical protein [Candidatus Falkowbacteria bacterium]MBT7348451.1 hypothetical protein [Candidatus Falkowbacteria bacterium]MBT7501205.1 hypothetical protein [Candidatus Falkowbacteria bacterium]
MFFQAEFSQLIPWPKKTAGQWFRNLSGNSKLGYQLYSAMRHVLGIFPLLSVNKVILFRVNGADIPFPKNSEGVQLSQLFNLIGQAEDQNDNPLQLRVILTQFNAPLSITYNVHICIDDGACRISIHTHGQMQLPTLDGHEQFVQKIKLCLPEYAHAGLLRFGDCQVALVSNFNQLYGTRIEAGYQTVGIVPNLKVKAKSFYERDFSNQANFECYAPPVYQTLGTSPPYILDGIDPFEYLFWFLSLDHLILGIDPNDLLYHDPAGNAVTMEDAQTALDEFNQQSPTEFMRTRIEAGEHARLNPVVGKPPHLKLVSSNGEET